MVFDVSQIIDALLGGLLIGASASIMLYFKGRIVGVSGIFAGAYSFRKDNLWKLVFILGLLLGGVFLLFLRPESFNITLNLELNRLIIAGLLVGFGTQLGSGCTSGHGVCGISRLSLRSIVATCCFIFGGVLTVLIVGVP